MYHDECRQGWCEEDGTLIVHDKDLRLKRQSIKGFLRDRQARIECQTSETLMNLLRDNDGVLFYDKARDAFYLTIGKDETHWRVLSIQTLLETSQHGNKTDVQESH